MVNNVVLVGRLTKDPELSTTTTGLHYCRFILAVDRNISKKTASAEDQTADFPSVTAWRGSAEFLANYAKKGDRVSVVGRIQTRNYEKTDGSKVYVTEIVADRVSIEESKNRGTVVAPQDVAQQSVAQPEPIAQATPEYSPTGAIAMDDDSLPF